MLSICAQNCSASKIPTGGHNGRTTNHTWPHCSYRQQLPQMLQIPANAQSLIKVHGSMPLLKITLATCRANGQAETLPTSMHHQGRFERFRFRTQQ